jgi:formate C-acetyltransferase
MLWPYLDKDLNEHKITIEEAKEIIDELFIRTDERIHSLDGYQETIVVGGTSSDGKPAINPLTSIMIESIMDLDITHPMIYIRMPHNPPEEFVDTCIRYFKFGKNRAQILRNNAVIAALKDRGMPYKDAVEYVCGGCMEISPQGFYSDFLFNSYHVIPKFVELAITGGKCLKSLKHLKHVYFKGLSNYSDFDSFYNDFEKEMKRILHIFFKTQDIFSEVVESSRPAYLYEE